MFAVKRLLLLSPMITEFSVMFSGALRSLCPPSMYLLLFPLSNVSSQIRIYSVVLDLAGMGLTLPIAAHKVLCFVF